MKLLTQKELFDGTISTLSESAERHKEITWKFDYKSLKIDGHEKPHIDKVQGFYGFLEVLLDESVVKCEKDFRRAPGIPASTGHEICLRLHLVS
jgi:hypothetical protein